MSRVRPNKQALESAICQCYQSAMNIETVRVEALALPAKARAELAEQLLSSLDTLSESEIESLWFQEAARRAAEMDQGITKRIPAEVVHREAQDLLK